MVNEKPPATPAILFLRERGVEFRPHSYRYDKDDVTGSAAQEVGVSTHEVVKTLVMEDDGGNPFIVLMHGDMQVKDVIPQVFRGILHEIRRARASDCIRLRSAR